MTVNMFFIASQLKLFLLLFYCFSFYVFSAILVNKDDHSGTAAASTHRVSMSCTQGENLSMTLWTLFTDDETASRASKTLVF